MDEIEELRAKVAQLEAEHAAGLFAVAALISTHPDPMNFHLALTRAFELQAGFAERGEAGGLLQGLSADQIEAARAAVEHLGAIRPTSKPDGLSRA